MEVHSLSHPVTVEISNVGESTPEITQPAPSCMIVERSDVIHLFNRGHFKDGYDYDDLANYSNQANHYLVPGVTFETTVETDSLFDAHLIICASQSVVSELRITMHYVDDELMWSAVLASLPSFIIFGIAIEGLMYRSKQIESDDISDINS